MVNCQLIMNGSADGLNHLLSQTKNETVHSCEWTRLAFMSSAISAGRTNRIHASVIQHRGYGSAYHTGNTPVMLYPLYENQIGLNTSIQPPNRPLFPKSVGEIPQTGKAPPLQLSGKYDWMRTRDLHLQDHAIASGRPDLHVPSQ